MELIEKQAAIDAMCLACGHDCDKSKFVYNAPQDEQVIMCPEHYALSTLPPAQLEPCNYVNACNELAKNYTSSTNGYLQILKEFKKYGYILVDVMGNIR